MLRPVYTVADVAEQLGCDDDAVRHWIHSGQLVAVDVSKSPRRKRPTWRITDEALQAFIAARSTRQPAAPPQKRRAKRETPGVIEFFR